MGTHEAMELVLDVLREQGGSFGLTHDLEKAEGWMAALEFGQEAPDSPMAGGAAYGVGRRPAEALAQLAGDLR